MRNTKESAERKRNWVKVWTDSWWAFFVYFFSILITCSLYSFFPFYLHTLSSQTSLILFTLLNHFPEFLTFNFLNFLDEEEEEALDEEINPDHENLVQPPLEAGEI